MKKGTIGLLLTFLALAFMFQACNNNSKPEADNYPGVIDSSSQIIKPVYISERSLNDTDDPAIWINPVDPSKSLILGTDKGNLNGGIYVYDLEGKIDSASSIFNLKRPNNIDVEYGFPFKGGKTDIAVFTERGRNMIRVYSLPDMMAIDNGGIEVFAGATDRDPMGIGIYHDKSASKFYAVVSRKSGPDGAYLWQYELLEENGIVTGTKVREFGQFKGKNEIEALVVDDELGYIYYSDEGVGVRQYFASPDRGNDELSVFATSGIKEDHEGLSIYKLTDTTGYILLSDQAAGRFHIFSREGTKDNPYEHRLLKIIGVEARDSDGSDVTSVAVNSTFKHGLFVVMSTDKTFHYYRWEDIAGKDLKMKWTDL